MWLTHSLLATTRRLSPGRNVVPPVLALWFICVQRSCVQGLGDTAPPCTSPWLRCPESLVRHLLFPTDH